MGTSKAVLLALFKSQNVSEREIADFEQWLNSLNWNTYKFIDRPLEIRTSDEGRLVRAFPQKVSSVAEAEQEPLLALHRFGDPGAPGADENGFFANDVDSASRQIALLVRVSADVARLDRFAEALAVLRWARQANAAWLGGIPDNVVQPAQTGMFLRGDHIELSPSRETLALEIAQRVSQQAKDLLDKAQSAVSGRFQLLLGAYC
jgi:hypothetical protein